MARQLNVLTLAALGVGLTIGPGAAAAPPPQLSPLVSGLTPPAPDLTTEEASRAYAQAMFICLGTRAANQTVENAPGDLRAAFTRASEQDRAFLSDTVAADAPVWVSVRVGHLLCIVEPSPARCEVVATQLPVEATFGLVVAAFQGYPAFTQVAVPPGFNPIAYQFEHVGPGANYTVHMEGAEPGAPGHQ